MHFSTILFDLDGTLTDPGAGIAKCIQAALRSIGLPSVPEPRLRDCVGPSLHASFEALGAQPHQIESLIEAYRSRYRETGMFENVVYPGVPDLLTEIRARNCRLFVTTSKPTSFAVAILEHFDLMHFFDDVFGAHLDGRLADKCDLLSHVRRHIDFEVSSTALVGDRKFDITAARAAGIFAIGALWGYGTRAELEAAGADRIAESPSCVVSALAA